MRTRVAMLCSVVAVACVMGFVPMAEGFPVGEFFTFDVGTNTISGFLFTNCIGPACDVDRLTPVQFDFSIPAHTELVGLTASFSGSWMQFWLSGAVSGEITYDPFPGADWDFAGSPCGEILCIQVGLPAGPGSTHVENNPFSWSPHTEFYEGPFGGDFQLDFTVAQVPEPSASLFLLGSGLAGLSGFAWWRRRN